MVSRSDLKPFVDSIGGRRTSNPCFHRAVCNTSFKRRHTCANHSSVSSFRTRRSAQEERAMPLLAWMSASEWQTLPKRAPTGLLQVAVCRSLRDLWATLDTHAVSCVVVDLETATTWLHDDGLRVALTSTSVVMQASLTVNSAQDILAMAQWPLRGRLSLRAYDDLCEDVAQVLSEREPTPEFRLLASLGASVPGPVRVPVVASIVVGHRRARLPDLSRACGIPARTIEWRLRRYGWAEASQLLGWSVALHTAWRIDFLNWSLKRAAFSAGFSDATTLSDYVERHVGARPRHSYHDGGFDRLRARWLAVVRRCGSSDA
jgi:hypothetical protein